MDTSTSGLLNNPVLGDHSDIPITLDDALEMNKVGFYQYRLLLLCGFAFMADALEVNLLSFLSVCAGKEWDLSDAEEDLKPIQRLISGIRTKERRTSASESS